MRLNLKGNFAAAPDFDRPGKLASRENHSIMLVRVTAIDGPRGEHHQQFVADGACTSSTK